ncbi:hypothetical protein GCM10007418_19930 [Halopseudomonas salina]|uniref:Secreted protein n=1 Tax=Halopseudomonas salina TaxID=1323744 RepID=A0ABQ1PPS4_9GAMM|nr:hypothetical protein GCM10007418_19930 [Halopseudomonas salina]
MALSVCLMFIIVLRCVVARREPKRQAARTLEGLRAGTHLDSYAGINRIRFNGYYLSRRQSRRHPVKMSNQIIIATRESAKHFVPHQVPSIA